jgi:hypothetical protein
MTQASFDQWLAGSTARLEGDTLVVGLASERAVDWVAHRFRRRMLATVRRAYDDPGLELVYEVRRDDGPQRGRGPPQT